MLDFEPVTLDKRGMMERYFLEWGEGSCQHSFAASFCLAGKYGTQVCERGGFLYILRSKAGGKDGTSCPPAGTRTSCPSLGGPEERVYLFPMGDPSDREALRGAVANVLDDAHEHGARVRFETLTRRAKDLTLELFPGTFAAQGNQDYAEYVYSVDKLVNLPGHELASRRKKIHHFFNEYGDRYQIATIDEGHIPLIRAFQRQWLEARISDDPQFAARLAQEDAGVQIGLDHFFELGLSGVVALIDGELRGYEYGAPLSRDCFDAMVQKGDRDIPEIYRILDWEFLRLCGGGYTWVKWEEDLGVESLRTMKTLYAPDRMIEKFIVNEVVA